MKFIADLHIHSHFSRATSRFLDPEHLYLWAKKKGITVLGTGDFTHPGWISEIKEKLEETREGLFRLKPEFKKLTEGQYPASCKGNPLFLLSTEISCIYKKNGKTRKLHHLLLMPDMKSVLKLNRRLEKMGNISSDGRPILGLDSRNLLEIALETHEKAFLIPAHVWTPWFSLFGSRSGFDTIEECFEDLTCHVHALETGLSSDPAMNRRLSSLDGYTLVSNSDAHSPNRLGREATLFDTIVDYDHILQAMTGGKGLTGTIEFFPEEGKYHLDGHRKCGIRLEPAETDELQGLCPKCHRPLTIGVLNRIRSLSDRTVSNTDKDFFHLIPLADILSAVLGCGPGTKKVAIFYDRLIAELGPELHILLNVPLKKLQAAGGPLFSEAVNRVREKRVVCTGGYDGQYGTVQIFSKDEREAFPV